MIIFSLPGNIPFTETLAVKLEGEIGAAEIRDFPDGDTYVRINSDVRGKMAVLVCTLDHPNNKVLPLLFLAQTIKELGAKKICLVTPYLPYMRQDKRFKSGEAVTSILFAKFLSSFVDCLITLDPHLHRIQQLAEIYSIPVILTLHAAKKISEWIQNNVALPFIIGPDEESRQWVSNIAEAVHAPYAIISKTRHGDRKVSVSVPKIYDISKTPVLVDDIISTGTSMLAAIQQLRTQGLKNPICIGIHALFSEKACKNLLRAGAQTIITCNTVQHPSNKIDITDIIANEIAQLAP